MKDHRVVVQTPNAGSYVGHEHIRFHGTDGEFLRIDCNNAVYMRVWATREGNVIVNIDHDETEIEDAEIVESKLYRGHDNE